MLSNCQRTKVHSPVLNSSTSSISMTASQIIYLTRSTHLFLPANVKLFIRTLIYENDIRACTWPHACHPVNPSQLLPTPCLRYGLIDFEIFSTFIQQRLCHTDKDGPSRAKHLTFFSAPIRPQRKHKRCAQLIQTG